MSFLFWGVFLKIAPTTAFRDIPGERCGAAPSGVAHIPRGLHLSKKEKKEKKEKKKNCTYSSLRRWQNIIDACRKYQPLRLKRSRAQRFASQNSRVRDALAAAAPLEDAVAGVRRARRARPGPPVAAVRRGAGARAADAGLSAWPWLDVVPLRILWGRLCTKKSASVLTH